MCVQQKLRRVDGSAGNDVTLINPTHFNVSSDAGKSGKASIFIRSISKCVSIGGCVGNDGIVTYWYVKLVRVEGRLGTVVNVKFCNNNVSNDAGNSNVSKSTATKYNDFTFCGKGGSVCNEQSLIHRGLDVSFLSTHS